MLTTMKESDMAKASDILGPNDETKNHWEETAHAIATEIAAQNSLTGDEAKCDNCYHEEDFPHDTMEVDPESGWVSCSYCGR